MSSISLPVNHSSFDLDRIVAATFQGLPKPAGPLHYLIYKRDHDPQISHEFIVRARSLYKAKVGSQTNLVESIRRVTNVAISIYTLADAQNKKRLRQKLQADSVIIGREFLAGLPVSAHSVSYEEYCQACGIEISALLRQRLHTFLTQNNGSILNIIASLKKTLNIEIGIDQMKELALQLKGQFLVMNKPSTLEAIQVAREARSRLDFISQIKHRFQGVPRHEGSEPISYPLYRLYEGPKVHRQFIQCAARCLNVDDATNQQFIEAIKSTLNINILLTELPLISEPISPLDRQVQSLFRGVPKHKESEPIDFQFYALTYGQKAADLFKECIDALFETVDCTLADLSASIQAVLNIRVSIRTLTNSSVYKKKRMPNRKPCESKKEVEEAFKDLPKNTATKSISLQLYKERYGSIASDALKQKAFFLLKNKICSAPFLSFSIEKTLNVTVYEQYLNSIASKKEKQAPIEIHPLSPSPPVSSIEENRDDVEMHPAEQPHLPSKRKAEDSIEETFPQKIADHTTEKLAPISFNPLTSVQQFIEMDQNLTYAATAQPLNPDSFQKKWNQIQEKKPLLKRPFVPVDSFEIRYINPKVNHGLFSKIEIRAGQVIGEYAGMIRPNRHLDKKNLYLFDLDGQMWNWVIDAQKVRNHTAYLNHSKKQPNVSAQCIFDEEGPHILFSALRDIQPGEELRYDYGDEYWEVLGIEPEAE